MLIFLLSCFFISLLTRMAFLIRGVRVFRGTLKMESFWKEEAMMADEEEEQRPSLLNLPELTQELILQKLSPAGLCSMSAVCSLMRERCRSDHLWGRHMEQKWGRVVGDVAHAEWGRQLVDSRRRPGRLPRRKGLMDAVSSFWFFRWAQRKFGDETKWPSNNFLPRDSIMALYLSLESGKFWFPAQVYNRENGHSGFMLSCYDGHISYDSFSDTFQARYSSQGGRRMVEENISWNRIREPPVSTLPYELYCSDGLNDLKPGDHIEIQWRKSKEFPYGWWYGVVGHLESCSGSEDCCHCFYSDTVTLEFHHYPVESRWRRKVINRKKHPEEGDQVIGFYGGIRKLHRDKDISKWKSLWPSRVPF